MRLEFAPLLLVAVGATAAAAQPITQLNGAGPNPTQVANLRATTSANVSDWGFKGCFGVVDPKPVAVIATTSVKRVRLIVRGVPMVAIRNGDTGLCRFSEAVRDNGKLVGQVAEIVLDEFPAGKTAVYFGDQGSVSDGSKALAGELTIIDISALPVVPEPVVTREENRMVVDFLEASPEVPLTNPTDALESVTEIKAKLAALDVFNAKVDPWLQYAALAGAEVPEPLRNDLRNARMRAKQMRDNLAGHAAAGPSKITEHLDRLQRSVAALQSITLGEHDTDFDGLTPELNDDLRWSAVFLAILETHDGKTAEVYRAAERSYGAAVEELAKQRAALHTVAVAKLRVKKEAYKGKDLRAVVAVVKDGLDAGERAKVLAVRAVAKWDRRTGGEWNDDTFVRFDNSFLEMRVVFADPRDPLLAEVWLYSVRRNNMAGGALEVVGAERCCQMLRENLK
ncbi:MAG: hypothetical protein IPH44_15430 [Myxococcales bacterium]|nr:hypothetical protein [Myxococcales bacterium]MBK7193318.1 hypothetical protein [Myxococcales bacterium]MBP6846201.1 hypothetical protein [Kofleriaceae bacterium]